LIVVLIYAQAESIYLFALGFLLVDILALLVMLVFILAKGNTASKIFVAGTALLALGTLVMLVGALNGANPEESIDYFQGGVLGEVFVFSLGLSYKFKRAEEARAQAQEKLIEQLRENQALQMKANLELEEKVRERTEEIRQQRDKIEESHSKIKASINYASRIQQAVLPSSDELAFCLPAHFVLYKPKDVVSGDFYYCKAIGASSGRQAMFVVAAADCTGHGVPGAFVSMLGVAFLNEIVGKQRFENAADILGELRVFFKTALHQSGEEGASSTKDGMDIALCVILPDFQTLHFAGAYNPLYRVREGILEEFKATRNPIGVYLKEKPFENHALTLRAGDCFYMFSDGYVDQFSGADDKKFMSKRFKELIAETAHLPMNEQRLLLDETIENWKGGKSQNDDILVLGFVWQ
jgi:serine phosphatase RsbU (regulator of sigma subunit)